MALQPWIVRKTGTDANGGTSKTVRSNGSDGVTNIGNNTLTSVTGSWSAADIGHGININGNWRLITAVASATSLTYSGASIATGTARPWTVGGPLLTLGKAASLVTAGDSVYLGAGTYREVNTFSISGSAGNPITYNGDFDGVYTGDPGDVLISNWLTSDIVAPTNTAVLIISSRIYLTFNHIGFLNGGTTVSCVNHATLADHIIFNDCYFVSTRTITDCIAITLKTDANSGCIFNRCLFYSNGVHINITHLTSTTADYDAGWAAYNCIFIGGANVIRLLESGAGSFKGGGGKVTQNTFYQNTPVVATSTTPGSFPCKVWNNYCIAPGTGVSAGATWFPIIEDWNIFETTTLARSNVGVGPNSINLNYPVPIEILSWIQTGRRARPFLQPTASSPVIGFMPVGTQIAVGIPTVAADDATVGTIVWTNPNNSLLLDNAFATCVLTAGTTGHYLVLTGFGFSLPTTATVTQVRVEIIAKSTVSANVLGNSIKLVKAGVISGNDNSALLAALTNTLAIYSVGGAADLWGLTLLYSDINAATFGVAISYKDTSGSAATANIDYVRVIVNYIDSAVTPVEQTVDFTGAARPAGGSIGITAGAFERGQTAVQEITTVHTGSNAIKLAGPSYQDFDLPVDGASTTVQAYMRYDGSYTGSLPTLSVVNGTECGVADASQAMVGAANTWELVQLTIVPTQKGVVTIRFRNRSGAAAGAVYVDTIGVA